MASIRLEKITQRINQLPLIENISFAVPDGQFWVLVGPSGCGKSTILRTIAGLMPITEGNLYIGDRKVNQMPARQRDVAMVFQNYALYPHMTVAQNLAFGLKMRNVPAYQIQPQIAAVARSLNLDQLMDRKPGQLSGGQQQRVALGRALARQPQVFLLDEPLSNLDAQLRDQTRAELKQLHQTFGITTLYVTHDQAEAMTLADQIVVLNQGRIQQMGAPQEIYANPVNQQVATFLGSPPMNLLPAYFDSQRFWIAGQWLPAPPDLTRLNIAPGHLNLGLRPEQVQVTATEEADVALVVTLVEPMGREIWVQGELSPKAEYQPLSQADPPPVPGTITVLVEPNIMPRPGARLLLRLTHLFVFDPHSQARVYPTHQVGSP